MNKLALIAAAAMTAATFGAAGVLAQSATDDFSKTDANKDGIVSFDEAMGTYPTLTQILFDQADANTDGNLDETEFGTLLGLVAGLDDGATSSSEASSSAM
ncbi:MAG: hypothetical protein HY834_01160 [Devosia nanyangense]|uniref:EF-hand domain-containing protein n=1 Tax=Devosia nanyangense TaxID=1228055 RepID=A0A933NXE4_9HYPH|nr:hypothetical protein [Devosia nanyangense]